MWHNKNDENSDENNNNMITMLTTTITTITTILIYCLAYIWIVVFESVMKKNKHMFVGVEITNNQVVKSQTPRLLFAHFPR